MSPSRCTTPHRILQCKTFKRSAALPVLRQLECKWSNHRKLPLWIQLDAIDVRIWPKVISTLSKFEMLSFNHLFICPFDHLILKFAITIYPWAISNSHLKISRFSGIKINWNLMNGDNSVSLNTELYFPLFFVTIEIVSVWNGLSEYHG